MPDRASMLSSGALAIHLPPVSGTWLVRPGWSGRGTGVLARGQVNTLLGPEGTGACPGLLHTGQVLVPADAGRGVVSVRILRTAQWTRASPVSANETVCNFVVPSF
jgi:hypothetical protein